MARPSLSKRRPPEGGAPHDPADVSEETRDPLALAESLCRARGARLTLTRRRVLEALLGSRKPLGAYDLIELLSPPGRRTAPITIYRALDFLIEQGLAHRLASRNAYIAGSPRSDAREPAVFLICDGCADVREITSPDLADSLVKVLRERGLEPRTRALEVSGYCAHCQDAR